jgi:4-hydroxybenzoate polyprenyltransferase
MASLAYNLLRLARPKQWAKSGFVLLGPLYGLRDHPEMATMATILAALTAAAVFALISSACYVVNDIFDAEKDRAHPRKSRRPIASGAVSVKLGWVYAACLAVAGIALGLLLPEETRLRTLAVAGIYAANVMAYSFALKHIVIVDVLSLSAGFVLRVIGGCAALAIEPSTWLLNVTLFLAMFLAFGKRLGERRTLGDRASSARGVQTVYTDDLLRMFVVVTAVATLITYAGYVQAREAPAVSMLGDFLGFHALWITMLPAMFAMLRAIVLLERGDYDDPTELAARDLTMQIAVVTFGILSVLAALGG